MEDFHINNTSQDKSFKYDYESSVTNLDTNEEVDHMSAVPFIIMLIGLIGIHMAICAVGSLVRKDHVVPIFVTILLISDLIRYYCLISKIIGFYIFFEPIIRFAYLTSLMVSVCFMVCIALERYLVIACPLWYRLDTIIYSVVLCVVVWILFPLGVLILPVLQDVFIERIIVGTSLLLPLPLLIFFLGGTIRALSASRVPPVEKRRIVGMLVLVLLIYTLMFLPVIIILFMAKMNSDHLPDMAYVIVILSFLADASLYVFMKKGTIDNILASVCCCRMDSNDISSSTV